MDEVVFYETDDLDWWRPGQTAELELPVDTTSPQGRAFMLWTLRNRHAGNEAERRERMMVAEERRIETLRRR